MSRVRSVDLGNSGLEGKLPDLETAAGALAWLDTLDLSSNNISGEAGLRPVTSGPLGIALDLWLR